MLLVASVLIAEVARDLQLVLPVVAHFAFGALDVYGGYVLVLQHAFLLNDLYLDEVVDITQETVGFVVQCVSGSRMPGPEESQIGVVALFGLQSYVGIDGGPVAQQLAGNGQTDAVFEGGFQ